MIKWDINLCPPDKLLLDQMGHKFMSSPPNQLSLNLIDISFCPPDKLLLDQMDINLCPPEKLLLVQMDINL